MAPKRNLLRDLHELARIEAGAEDTQRALERVQVALNEPSTKPIPVFPLFGVKLDAPATSPSSPQQQLLFS